MGCQNLLMLLAYQAFWFCWVKIKNKFECVDVIFIYFFVVGMSEFSQ